MSLSAETQTLVHRVVQVRLPVRNIDESVAWYEKYFGFVHIWKTEEESDLKLEPGPYLFLKRVDQPQSVRVMAEGKPYAVVCIKTSDVHECRRRMLEAGETVSEITHTWNIERLMEFDVTDPSGNVINVASYPDIP